MKTDNQKPFDHQTLNKIDIFIDPKPASDGIKKNHKKMQYVFHDRVYCPPTPNQNLHLHFYRPIILPVIVINEAMPNVTLNVHTKIDLINLEK